MTTDAKVNAMVGDVTSEARPNPRLFPCPVCGSTALGPYKLSFSTPLPYVVKCCDCQLSATAATPADVVTRWQRSAEHDQLLRRLLWSHHGCHASALYGDDGEMQCGECGVDFRRLLPVSIVARFRDLVNLWAKDPENNAVLVAALNGSALPPSGSRPVWLSELEHLRREVAEGRRQAGEASTAFQLDVHDLLVACGLVDTARPYSSHDVVVREVLPRIGELWKVIERTAKGGCQQHVLCPVRRPNQVETWCGACQAVALVEGRPR